jgi:hypothetical protein
MLIREILLEMSSVTRRRTGTFPLYNGGQGQYGNILNYEDQVLVYPDFRDKVEVDAAVESPYLFQKETKKNVGKTAAGPAAFNRANKSGNSAFNNAVKELASQAQAGGGKVVWMNPEVKTTAGAIVSRRFTNEKNQVFYFAKFLSDNLGSFAGGHDPNNEKLNKWDNNFFEKIGYITSQGNRFGKHSNQQHLKDLYKKALKTGNWDEVEQARGNIKDPLAAGERDSFGPKGVLTNMDNLTTSSIVDQIDKKFADTRPELVKIAEMAAKPGTTVYPVPAGMDAGIFAKSFCEILHPMAVVAGNLDLPGYKGSLAGAKITFPSSNSEALSDSYLTIKGNKILLSSKAGGGTRSSLGSIGEYLKQTKFSPEEKQYYSQQLKALQTIAEKAQKPNPKDIGPLQIAVDLGLLADDGTAEYIAKLDPSTPQDYQSVNRTPKEIPADAPQSVRKLIAATTPAKGGPSPYHQAIYTVMNQVADYFNKDQKMSQLLKKVLARANYYLINTVRAAGGVAFSAKPLQEEAAQIKISLGESYHRDHIKKKLAFEIA